MNTQNICISKFYKKNKFISCKIWCSAKKNRVLFYAFNEKYPILSASHSMAPTTTFRTFRLISFSRNFYRGCHGSSKDTNRVKNPRFPSKHAAGHSRPPRTMADPFPHHSYISSLIPPRRASARTAGANCDPRTGVVAWSPQGRGDRRFPSRACTAGRMHRCR